MAHLQAPRKPPPGATSPATSLIGPWEAGSAEVEGVHESVAAAFAANALAMLVLNVSNQQWRASLLKEGCVEPLLAMAACWARRHAPCSLARATR